jgi:hypothetical protein
MSNGAACCALEICCNAAQKRARLVKVIATFTGYDEEDCGKFLDWMHHEELVFAPASMQAVIHDVATIARKHKDEPV